MTLVSIQSCASLKVKLLISNLFLNNIAFEASDADDGSSVASQSLNLSSSRVVEREGEMVSLVKRNLLPSTPSNTSMI